VIQPGGAENLHKLAMSQGFEAWGNVPGHRSALPPGTLWLIELATLNLPSQSEGGR